MLSLLFFFLGVEKDWLMIQKEQMGSYRKVLKNVSNEYY